MELKEMLSAVRNERIEFVTMRPPGTEFAVLDRRVVVTGPSELVKLAELGELQALDELVKLLREPDQAWAAEVLLAAMTRREEKIVDSFASTPKEWRDSVGKSAYERWSKWLLETKGKLIWDSGKKAFVERE